MRHTIGWIQISMRRYGGNAYGDLAEKVLRNDFDVEQKRIYAKYILWRYAKPFEWGVRLFNLHDQKDLWVTQSFLVVAGFSFSRLKGKKLALIHHLDNSVFPRILRPIFFLIEAIFYRNLKKIDAIITVSEYWKEYFLKRGYRNVYKIYSGFKLSDFDISEQEVQDFKKRWNLQAKPIVYIGNCQKAKGVIESYEALKDLDVSLVTSGQRQVDIPALHLDLEYKEYLRLLKASTIVVTMSKFKEGWCRTAHEAMLSKIPVIGSGTGGMRELLEGGGQIVCEDFSLLKKCVSTLLLDEEERRVTGERGHTFAQQFTIEKFSQEWLRTIRSVVDS